MQLGMSTSTFCHSFIMPLTKLSLAVEMTDLYPEQLTVSLVISVRCNFALTEVFLFIFSCQCWVMNRLSHFWEYHLFSFLFIGRHCSQMYFLLRKLSIFFYLMNKFFNAKNWIKCPRISKCRQCFLCTKTICHSFHFEQNTVVVEDQEWLIFPRAWILYTG